VGRAKAFEAIVKGIDIPASTVPESFKVLVKELQALGLNVVPTGAVTVRPQAQPTSTTIVEEQVKKEAEQIARASGGETIADSESPVKKG